MSSWFRRSHVCPTLVAVAVVGTGVFVAQHYRAIVKRLDAVSAKVTAATEVFEAGMCRLSNGFTDCDFAFSETPGGLELVPARRGVTQSDLDFLRLFRAPLVDAADVDVTTNATLEKIKSRLVNDFESTKCELTKFGLNERQAFIAHVMLRVNGSMPVYEVRNELPREFERLIRQTSGNCSDFSVRLMFALEAVAIQSALISNVSTHIPGHCFVDAFDPEDDTPYLLDANNNVMIFGAPGASEGFLASLLAMSESQRATFADEAKIVTFPVYFRYVDAGELAFQPNSITRDSMNENRTIRREMWQWWLAEDVAQLVEWWKQTPSHRPRTLSELAAIDLIELPTCFETSHAHAACIRKTAGLEIETAARETTSGSSRFR